MNYIKFQGNDLLVENTRLSIDADKNVTVEVIGESVRMNCFSDELCEPYIRIAGIEYDFCLDIFEKSWLKSNVFFGSKTYFSLFGEGFSLISGSIIISLINEKIVNIQFSGETDFPVQNGNGEISFNVVCKRP